MLKNINKTLVFAIVVALLGALLLACYFIPVISPSKRYDDGTSFSCSDIIVAMNVNSIQELAELNESQSLAYSLISETEGKAGKDVKAIGVLGLIEAMVGALILLVAIAAIFVKAQSFRIILMGLSVSALAISIAVISLLCVYLNTKVGAGTYSYYSAVGASAFIMMSAGILAGAGSWFVKQK